MRQKNNKKCNIKINDKNIEAYNKENISDYAPELKLEVLWHSKCLILLWALKLFLGWLKFLVYEEIKF